MKITGDVAPLAKALAQAQAEMPDAVKDATNPHFKKTYATLASVKEAVMPALIKAGFAVTHGFSPRLEAKGVSVVTVLMHASGGMIESELFIPVGTDDPQKYVAAITYARRASLAAIAGCVADEDDDGESVKPEPRKPSKPALAGPPRQDPKKVAEVAATNKAIRTKISDGLMAWTDETLPKPERVRQAQQILAQIIPGKTATAQLDEMEAKRAALALELIPMVPGSTIQALNEYVEKNWAMSPVHKMSDLEIESARKRARETAFTVTSEGEPTF